VYTINQVITAWITVLFEKLTITQSRNS